MNPQDPLAQLRDIHLPQAITWWPPAPGWWVLASLCLLLVAAGSWYFYRRYQRDSFRRQALRLLQSHFLDWQQSGDSRLYMQQVNIVLKRTALLRFPESNVAALSGPQWMAFLDRYSPQSSPGFSDGPLTQGPYAPPAPEQDVEALQRLALTWLRQHREAADA